MLAFIVYALVPYLGILFCPGAIVAGSLNLLYAYRCTNNIALPDGSRQTENSRVTAALGVLAGCLILAAQLLLWWLLYKAPEWALG